MSVDRGWMERRVNPNGGKVTQEFKNGVTEFLKFAYNHPQFVAEGTIKCPCSKCALSKFQDRQTVKSHLHQWGFRSLYTRWYEHGEFLKLETNEHYVSVDQQSQQKERRPLLWTPTPTDAERQTEWWKASAKYFAGVDDQRRRPVKNKKARSPSPSRPAKKARSPSPPPSSQVQDTCNLDHVPSAIDSVDACGMPTLDTTTTPYKEDCHTAGTESTSDAINYATISRSDTAPTYQQLLQRVATLEDTVKQLVQRVTTLEGPSHVVRDTVLEGAIPSTANFLPRTIPIKSTDMPLRAAEFRACSLEDQQHHHIDKDGCVASTLPRADTSSRQTTVPTPLDKRVATMDEKVTALESGQGAILDMVTRLPVFSKTVQLLSDSVEVEQGNRPSLVEITETVHKRQKGKGEWRDSKAENVAFNICENIKEKIVSEYETADDSGQPSDDPFDSRTWAEVICVPEKKEVNGAGCSQEAENTLNQSNSTSSTKGPHCNTSAPDDNETETELEIKARIEAEVKSRVELVRLEMKKQMEKQFKLMLESL